MAANFVMRPEAFNDGYLIAYKELLLRSVPTTEGHLLRRIKLIDNATSRRSYMLCLVDFEVVPLGLAVQVLSNAAEPPYIEMGIPNCYFYQPRPI